MKASSGVMINVQRPVTFAGLPLTMFAVMAAGMVITFVLPALFQLLPLSILLSLIFLVSFWTWAFRARSRDHHFDAYFFKALPFWKGKASRCLVAGQAIAKGNKS